MRCGVAGAVSAVLFSTCKRARSQPRMVVMRVYIGLSLLLGAASVFNGAFGVPTAFQGAGRQAMSPWGPLRISVSGTLLPALNLFGDRRWRWCQDQLPGEG